MLQRPEEPSAEQACGRERVARLLEWRAGRKPPPVELVINITNLCNLNCVFCPGAHGRTMPDMRRVNELSDDEWMKVIEDAAAFGVREWKITGGGDPMARKSSTISLVSRIKGLNRGFFCCLMTNATLMTERDIETLVGCGLDRIEVSLDGPDAAVHDLLRGRKGSFERVTRTLKTFAATRERLGARLPEVWAGVTVTRLNTLRFKEIVALCSECGVDRVIFNPLIVYRDLLRQTGALLIPAGMRSGVEQAIEAALAVARELDCDVRSWPVDDYLYRGEMPACKMEFDVMEPEQDETESGEARPPHPAVSSAIATTRRKRRCGGREGLYAEFQGSRMYIEEPAGVKSGHLAEMRGAYNGFLSRRCFSPFLSLVISAMGTIRSCILRSAPLGMLNVREAGVESAWFSEELHWVREAILRGDVKKCGDCGIENMSEALRREVLLLAPDFLDREAIGSLMEEVLDPALLVSLGQGRLSAGDAATAARYFARAVDLDQKSLKGWIGLARSLKRAGADEQGRMELERARAALEPADAANTAIEAGFPDVAGAIIEASEAGIPRVGLSRLRGKLAFSEGVSDVGKDLFEEAIRLDSGKAEAARELVSLLCGAKRFREAVETVERYGVDIPASSLAVMCIDARLYEKAASTVLAEVGKPENCRDEIMLRCLMRSHMSLERFKDAESVLAVLREVVETPDNEMELWSAKLNRAAGREEEAVRVLDACWSRGCRTPDCLRELAELLYDLGRGSEAARYFGQFNGQIDESDRIAVRWCAGDRNIFDEYKPDEVEARGNVEIAGVLGRIAKEAGDYDLGRRYFKTALRLEPAKLKWKRELAECLVKAREKSETVSDDLPLDTTAEGAEALYWIGKNLRMAGELDKAAACLGKAVRIEAARANLMEELAMVEIDRGNSDGAREIVRTAGDSLQEKQKGRLMFLLGEYGEAVRLLGGEGDLEDEDAYMFAVSCSKCGRTPEGIDVLKRLVEKAAADRRYRLALVEMLNAEKRYEEARECLNAIKGVSPEEMKDLLYREALFHLDRGDKALSLKYMMKLASIEPRDPVRVKEMIEFTADTLGKEEALKILRENKDALAPMAAADLMANLGDLEGALKVLDASGLVKEPPNFEAAALGGRCLALLKRHEEALPVLDRARALCPPGEEKSLGQVLLLLVECLLSTGKIEEAAGVFRKPVEEELGGLLKSEYSAEILSWTGRLKKLNGDYTAAAEALLRSWDLGWREENSLLDIVDCLDRLGRRDEIPKYVDQFEGAMSRQSRIALLWKSGKAGEAVDMAVEVASEAASISKIGLLEAAAHCLLDAGRCAEALACFERLQDLGVDDLLTAGRIARCCLGAGKPARAFERLRAGEIERLVKGIKPADREQAADALMWISMCFREGGRLDDAVKCLQAAIGFCPSSPDLVRNCIDMFVESGRRDDALSTVRSHGTALPLQVRVYYYFSMREHARVLEELEISGRAAASADETWRKEPEMLIAAGVSCMEIGRPADAADLMRAALKLAPGLVRARTALFECLLACGRPDEAVSEIAAGGGAVFEEDIIGCMLRAGKAREAARRLVEIGGSRKYRDSARRLYLLARCYKEAGNNARALRCYGRYISRNPGDAAAARDAGECLFDLGRFREALERLRSAAAIAPSLEWTRFSIGKACEALGEKEEARRWHRGNLEQAGQNPLSYFHSCLRLGSMAEADGDMAEAARMYEKALVHRPADAEARGRLERCRAAMNGGPG